MNYGVDVTRPAQLRPNGPDKRTEYAVLKADGFLHVITASVWRYDGGFEPKGTLNVHIGCSTLVTDMVRDGESEWDAIRRVVTTWQQAQRDADHAAALEIMAMVDAQLVEANHPAETDDLWAESDIPPAGLTDYTNVTTAELDAMIAADETAAREREASMPLGDVHSAHCTACGWRMDDSPVSLYTDAVSHWVESGGHETVHGYRNMWGEYRVSGRFSGDPSKRYGQ